MKSFRQFVREEGIAANCAGGGAVAGIGVGPQGEPPGIVPGARGKKRHGEKIKNKRRIIGTLGIGR